MCSVNARVGRGAMAEGSSRAVARFVSDAVESGLVSSDGGSFG